MKNAIMRIADGKVKTHSQAKNSHNEMNHTGISSVYMLTVEQWRMVDKYLDETYQWILLVDGRRVRTRSFIRDWELYIPVDFKVRHTANKDFNFTKQIVVNRILSRDHHCKHKLGTIKLWFDENIAKIEVNVSGAKSMLTCEIQNRDEALTIKELVHHFQKAGRLDTLNAKGNLMDLFGMVAKFNFLRNNR